MSKKNKARIAVVAICLIVALPFYVSVWTWEGITLAEKWLATGGVLFVQSFISSCYICMTYEEEIKNRL